MRKYVTVIANRSTKRRAHVGWMRREHELSRCARVVRRPDHRGAPPDRVGPGGGPREPVHRVWAAPRASLPDEAAAPRRAALRPGGRDEQSLEPPQLPDVAMRPRRQRLLRTLLSL